MNISLLFLTPIAFCLLLCMTVWSTVYGQECLNQKCKCCVVPYTRCQHYRGTYDYCLDGCKDGLWSHRCYIPCPSNCVTCDQSSTDSGYPCTQCTDKTYYGDNCNTSCSPGCNGGTCNIDGSCSCLAGYSGDKCCLDNDNCDTCVSNTQCQICKSGYSGDMCCVNSNHCKTCSSSTTCSNCENGYSGDMCCVNNDKCVTCLSGQTCSQCVDGYSGDKCCLQNSYCEICSSSSDCSICVAGRYGNLCQHQCDDKCITCTSATNCTSCISGYYGSLCIDLCPNNCIECTTSTSCKACKPGFKGTYCQETCYNCKPGTHCDQNNGKCDECINGKSDVACNSNCRYPYCLACERDNKYTCTECKVGKYRLNNQCTFNCPSNTCLDNKCDVDTGECPACTDGFYGTYCKCPVNCETCDTNGKCQSCIEGYYNINTKCECRNDKCLSSGCDKCTDITWYPDVSSQSCCQCSSSCKGEQCVSKTECASGCEDGYYGKVCDRLCSDIDSNCLQCTSDENDSYNKCSKCSFGYNPGTNYCQVCNLNCNNANCDQSTGKCLDGCKIRFWRDTCGSSCSDNCLACNQVTGDCEVCKSGKYKTDCSVSCSANCKVLDGEDLKCKINDGSCMEGCISTKFYGFQCNEKCSENCKDKDCEWQTGNCLTCVVNRYGPICGDQCSNNCVKNSQDRLSTRCYGENGTCTFGCISGFRGFKCEDSCSQFCSNTTCGQLNGECLHGCIYGFTGGTCTQVSVLSEDDNEGVPVAVFGGAIGGVAAIGMIIVVIVVILMKRRNNQPLCSSTATDDGTQGQDNTKHVYVNTMDNATGNSSMPGASEYHELGEITNDLPVIIENDTETITHDYESLDEQQREQGNYDDLVVPQYENTKIDN